MSIFDEVTQRVTAQLSGSITGVIKSISASGIGTALVKNAVGKFAPEASGALSKALAGNFTGAVLDGLSQTAIGAKVNSLLHSPLGAELEFEGLRNPLLGGITPFEARQIIQEVQSTRYAKKNLFFLEIVDFDPRVSGSSQNSSGLFNLFATSVSVGPRTINGEGHAIGSAVMDGLSSTERVEMRITTYDDAAGSIKAWFKFRSDLIAHSDGSFGVPADYLVQVRVLHAAVNDDAMAAMGGYQQKFIMRLTSLETELSRSEDGLQEIQIALTQFDTFMFGP